MLFLAALLSLVLGLSACIGVSSDSGSIPGQGPDRSSGANTGGSGETLRIVAGSEQRAVLDRVVLPWCEANNYRCSYDLLGSVDQARLLQSGSKDYDAYWFASSVFAQMGNDRSQLNHIRPMFLTPTVFAGWKPTMERWGLVGRTDVTVADVIRIAEDPDNAVWATNPTQSNSGATTFFAFLNHFAGNGPGRPLTPAQLDSPQVEQGITTFTRAMERTPPSTGTMMTECLANAEACDAMFTYEDLVIEHNQELVAQGRDPLYVVYPTGALAISDAPLGFLPGGEPGREGAFLALQDYLLNDQDARQQLLGLGRRPADSVGLAMNSPDLAVFNPDWGVRTDIRERGVTFPAGPVITEALNRYNTRYRRPVDIYYCLDGSGSMRGNGWDGVKRAGQEIFDPERAQVNLLQSGPGDVTTVQIFHDGTAAGPWRVTGSEPGEFTKLVDQINGYAPDGGTNLYACLTTAVGAQANAGDRKRLIVAMTDGRSQNEGAAPDTIARVRAAGTPVIAIAFGDADPTQLAPLAEQTGGSLVESDDLVSALRLAAGYR